MKFITLLLAGICLVKLSSAQQPLLVNNPYPKTITVSGSAEMEIVPDEIYVNVLLSEYQKKGDPKRDLEGIKSGFLESCKAVGIADSLISIVSYSGNNANYYFYYLRKKKKNEDLMATITYQVKFKNSKMMDDVVEKLDDNATQSFQIVSVNHSRMVEFRRQLKIKAIQAAKDKGLYLTEAVGEKLGEAITINEPDEIQPDRDNNNLQVSNTVLSQVRYRYDSIPSPLEADIDFRKLKLRFEVSVIFALK